MRSRYSLVTPENQPSGEEQYLAARDFAPISGRKARENPLRLRFVSALFTFSGISSAIAAIVLPIAAARGGFHNAPLPFNPWIQAVVFSIGSWTSFRTGTLLRRRMRQGGTMALTYYALIAAEMLIRGQVGRMFSSVTLGVILLASVWDLLE